MFSIGRLYYCHPSPTNDRFYLRMLLHIVRGAGSFEDIRTVNGVLHKSFKEACYAHGLLAEDNEWNDCLVEASAWASGKKLRALFVTIISMCQVSDIGKLWERNWSLLSDDILYARRKELNMPTLEMTDIQLKECCLLEIDKLLARNCKTLSDFPGLPVPNLGNVQSSSNRLITTELSYNATNLGQQFEGMVSKLNAQQRIAFDEITDSVYGDKGRAFFIDGCGGTGKTFLWKVICLKLRSEMKIVLCVASSGIAALLMDGGRTAHSRFHIPVDLDGRSTCHIDQESELAELIQRASLIIWDEVVMSHKHAVEAVDRSLRDILRFRYQNSQGKPFGGLTVVFGGDFRQTLPIVLKGSRADIVNSSIKRSYLWHHLRVIKLVENMRLARANCSPEEVLEIANFHTWLLQVGDGADSDVYGESSIPIPPELIVPRQFEPVIDIVSSIYGDLRSHARDHNYLVNRAILAPHHDMVSAVNGYILGEFPGDEVSYFSCDSIEIDPGKEGIVDADYSTEFLNTLIVGNFPDHELKLKVGCPVILLRNMDQTIGLCNGTRMVVKTLGKWFIEVEILTGTNVGDRVFLPRLTLSTHYKSLNFTLIRRQYPVSLCFAMTINKSQGQTLAHVGLCLQRQVFTHGQLYVALSRITTRQGLKILIGNENGEDGTSMVNIVFPEIFE
ncbi:unnamed protein product [Linum trigynum]|uniref:ATP-dependent DNA helicase n=1 Tax=Linum trigynum TaxID=586398 RepID=A0AAV2GTU7_9ROSI